MSGLRLALVTRRFWPLAGSEETLMSDLAVEFQRQGASVRILTAQWGADWPADMVHREVPVVRLRKPPQVGWGILRYMMALSRWLRQHEKEIDLAYVSHMQHDAHAVIGALANAKAPVVLRAVGSGVGGDCRWQERARFGARIRRRCQTADAVIASNQETLAELAAAGYAVNRTYQIANGVDEGPPRSVPQKLAARAALAAVNSDLGADNHAPVAVYAGRLVRSKGVFDLLRAWQPIVASRPNAKLWLIGDGPDREGLYDAVRDYDLRHNVALPGTFDDVQDVLHAADVCVMPSPEEASSMTILEAMAAGTPLVASDISGHRATVRDEEQALLVPPGDHRSLAQAIIQVFDNPGLAAVRAAAARNVARERFSLRQVAAEHLELFERLIAEKRKA